MKRNLYPLLLLASLLLFAHACYVAPLRLPPQGSCRTNKDCLEGQVCLHGICTPMCAGEQCTQLEDAGSTPEGSNVSCQSGASRLCFTGPPNANGVGACKPGTQKCVNGGWGTCLGQRLPTNETCNGVDDNCNGQIDENAGCQCKDGDKRVCGSNVGECVAGAQVCTNGQWGSCIGEVAKKTESCNQLDDDCDGQTDEDGVCPTCKGSCTTNQDCVPCGVNDTCVSGKCSSSSTKGGGYGVSCGKLSSCTSPNLCFLINNKVNMCTISCQGKNDCPAFVVGNSKYYSYCGPPDDLSRKTVCLILCGNGKYCPKGYQCVPSPTLINTNICLPN
ncbi:MAG TPA: hypothetical protein DCE42_01360 [Myxococcales bacterium]|nr:hypothetical protein [Deltaproteobacteria bacterium]MBU53031.1 hypothetical protein [Deltaproteobacteria bacterium]HAA53370.1 hypothetical protein [Myxococcales bacterium]